MRLRQYLTETPQVIDLRKNYDKKAKVKDGTLYLKGAVVQVWWERDAAGRKFKGTQGRETWSMPDPKQAKRGFKDMKEMFNEGKTDFWKDFTEYMIRELGKDVYEVSVWKRGDTPSQIYKCTGRKGKIMCSCPARGPCKHIKMVADWINKGKPEHPYFKDVMKKVKKGLKI